MRRAAVAATIVQIWQLELERLSRKQLKVKRRRWEFPAARRALEGGNGSISGGGWQEAATIGNDAVKAEDGDGQDDGSDDRQQLQRSIVFREQHWRVINSAMEPLKRVVRIAGLGEPPSRLHHSR